MNLICKIFGHKPIGVIPKRMFAGCKRCPVRLKVSYDITYGATIVVGDYGEQGTFVWCDCGNELISTNSFVSDTDLVRYKCSKCGVESGWNFDCLAPFRVYPTQEIKEND